MFGKKPLSAHTYVFFILSVVPYVFSAPEQKKEPINFDEVIFSWSRTFAEILQATNTKHYKIANPEQAMTKAIDAFLTSLDPHSNFLDPKTYKHILETTSGEFFGIGIVIDNTRQPKDKFLIIIDTIPDGPADKIGIKPLDKIVEIDGSPLEGMSTEEATAKLKGERKSKVHVKVMRENVPDMLEFDIVRDVIKEQSSMCFYLPDQKIYYLSLSTFSENSVTQLKELLEKAKKNQHKGLILDLRNNSGGLLTAAIDIAGLFLEKGSLVVVTKNKHNEEIDRYETSSNPLADGTLPIFILINNYTASAGEILAGCLKLHSEQAGHTKGSKRKLMVFLVGSKTFGKGSVQEVIPITSNCAIKLTTSLYFLPKDVSIQGTGIEPDFIIERKMPQPSQVTWFTKYYGREKALENYINIQDDPEDAQAKKEVSKEKSWSDRAKDMLNQDNQFRETITLINLYNAAKTHCSVDLGSREKALKFMKSIYIANDPLNLEEVKS